MTRIGSIGDCKLIDSDVDASFYVSLMLLKIHSGCSAEFISHYSKSASFQNNVLLNSLPTAIAEVLTEMDSELAALEQRRDKTRALKQGMMQELLTGKTRLV